MITVYDLRDMRYLKIYLDCCAREIEQLERSKERWRNNREYIAAVNELLKTIKDTHKKDIARYEELCAFVDGITDREIKDLITAHYINGIPWVKIGIDMYCGSADGAKKMVYRYLKKNMRDAENIN